MADPSMRDVAREAAMWNSTITVMPVQYVYGMWADWAVLSSAGYIIGPYAYSAVKIVSTKEAM